MHPAIAAEQNYNSSPGLDKRFGSLGFLLQQAILNHIYAIIKEFTLHTQSFWQRKQTIIQNLNFI